ncbi:MAG: hypothetical protein M1142_05245 [Patescibacteria group bacterium]|nr:hypothetical protein [Patescibacteria group bacterium]
MIAEREFVPEEFFIEEFFIKENFLLKNEILIENRINKIKFNKKIISHNTPEQKRPLYVYDGIIPLRDRQPEFYPPEPYRKIEYPFIREERPFRAALVKYPAAETAGR